MVPVLTKYVRKLLFWGWEGKLSSKKQVFCDIFLVMSIYLKFYENMSNLFREMGRKQ